MFIEHLSMGKNGNIFLRSQPHLTKLFIYCTQIFTQTSSKILYLTSHELILSLTSKKKEGKEESKEKRKNLFTQNPHVIDICFTLPKQKKRKKNQFKHSKRRIHQKWSPLGITNEKVINKITQQHITNMNSVKSF